MAVPLCHFCGGDPMLEKARIPHGNDKQFVIYQCDQCKRITSQTE